ncbi:MAG: hypothetical protein ABH805_01565 [Candidatus Nealsonbacteria bacterium]
MTLLEKLQNLPEKIKKVILWSVVIMIGSTVLMLWFNNFQDKLQKFNAKEAVEELNIPEFKKPDLSGVSEEELEQIKQDLEQNAK